MGNLSLKIWKDGTAGTSCRAHHSSSTSSTHRGNLDRCQAGINPWRSRHESQGGLGRGYSILGTLRYLYLITHLICDTPHALPYLFIPDKSTMILLESAIQSSHNSIVIVVRMRHKHYRLQERRLSIHSSSEFSEPLAQGTSFHTEHLIHGPMVYLRNRYTFAISLFDLYYLPFCSGSYSSPAARCTLITRLV